MADQSRTPDVEKLQLSDEDTEDLWASPSKVNGNAKAGSRSYDAELETSHSRNGASSYNEEESRDGALRRELESVRKVNEALEGVLESLDRAKDNMEASHSSKQCSVVLLTMLLHRLSPERSPQHQLSSTHGREYFRKRNTTKG